MKIYDTYFFDYKEAFSIAKQQNKSGIFNDLQICYYNGEEYKDNPFDNLIALKVENLCDYLTETPNRVMSRIVFSKAFNRENRSKMDEYFQKLRTLALNKKLDIGLQYKSAIKNQTLDFSEPLRILFITTRRTTVLQHVIKNLEKTFRDKGYQTFLSIEQNDMQSWGMNDEEENPYFTWHLKNIYDYNPHVIFSIDYIYSRFLNENIFQFVWFQDNMDIFKNKQKLDQRKRDYIFHLTEHLGKILLDKEVKSEYQPFCINREIYLKREDIERKEKIVFIGSSYKAAFDNVKNQDKYVIVQELLTYYIENGYMPLENRLEFMLKYTENLDSEHIFNYVERDLLLIYILSLNIDYKIEVYGRGWEVYDELTSHYKGIINYGEDLSKVYNSAKYCLVIGGYVMQQRTLESAASGSIPLVFDVRSSNADLDSECFDESLVFFNKPSDLKDILPKSHKKNLECIVKKNSYEKFADKIIGITKKNVYGE